MFQEQVPGEETQKFQEYANINQNHWNQRFAAVERLLVFDDGENDSLEDDALNSADKTTHLTPAVLRRCVEMTILSQPYLHRPHRDPSSNVTMLGDDVGMIGTNREV